MNQISWNNFFLLVKQFMLTSVQNQILLVKTVIKPTNKSVYPYIRVNFEKTMERKSTQLKNLHKSLFNFLQLIWPKKLMNQEHKRTYLTFFNLFEPKNSWIKNINIPLLHELHAFLGKYAYKSYALQLSSGIFF